MNPTKIDYLDLTWNPYTGCNNWRLGICGGGGKDFRCWAMTQTIRFKKNYPNGFEPTFYPERFLEPMKHKKPAIIGVSFMGDLFGGWPWASFPESANLVETMDRVRLLILNQARACPRHTFVFLTKCPWNLPKWNPWPDNAWVGVSITSVEQLIDTITPMAQVEASVKFASYEPLLERVPVKHIIGFLNWLIIGGQTGPGAKPPKPKWVQEIIDDADRAGVPVFLKDNLHWPESWQEWPKEKG